MITATDLKANFEDIKTLVDQGKAMENETPATVGKAANRARELDFFSKVTEFRAAELKAVAYGEDVIISEWFVDYTHSEWGKVTHAQVSVQRWKDGQVIHERFYYAA